MVIFSRALAAAALASAAAWVMDGAYSLASQAMAYLLAVVYCAFRFGRREAMLTSAISVVALNFFFIPPRYTLAVANPEYLITLAALLLVSMVVSGLATRLKVESAQAQLRERRARQLHALANNLAAAEDESALRAISTQALSEAFGPDPAVLLADASGELEAGTAHGIDADAARWTFQERRSIGPMTKYWPELDRWYTPLPGNETALGVAAVAAPSQVTPGMEEDLRHLEAIARQIGLALQREQLARQAQAAALEARSESLRNALLASISHDLRTPLAAIVGSATTLSGQREQLSEAQQSELLRNIEDEAMQMTAVAENILQLARLSAEETRLRRDWASIGEIVGTVVGRQRRRGEQRVVARVNADLPLVRVDAVLIEQVLANLIQNALRHAPGAEPIEISASANSDHILVCVADRGEGFGTADPALLFAKSPRGRGALAQGGAGLGLAICKAIAELHGGSIQARNRDGGGALFEFTLPFAEEQPSLPQSGGRD